MILTPQFNRQKWDMTNRHGQVHFILHDWSNLKQQQKTQRFLKKDVSEPTYLYVLYFSIQTTTYSKCFIHLNNLVEMPEKKGLCFESGVATHLEKSQTVANYTEYIRTFQRHFFMNVNKVFFVEFVHKMGSAFFNCWRSVTVTEIFAKKNKKMVPKSPKMHILNWEWTHLDPKLENK